MQMLLHAFGLQGRVVPRALGGTGPLCQGLSMPHNSMHFHNRESKSDWVAPITPTGKTYLSLPYFKHNPLIQAQIALHFQLQKDR